MGFLSTCKSLKAIAVHVVILLLTVSFVSGQVISTAVASGPTASITITTASGAVKSMFPALPLTNCDGVGTFFCATGTCYTGYDGYVGCCTVSNCAARTTCIPYTKGVSQTCDSDTGGCVSCAATLPACVTISNVVNSQHIIYCDKQALMETLSYSNLVTTGSMALLPGQTSTHHSVASATSTTVPSSTQADTYVSTNIPDAPPGAATSLSIGGIITAIVVTLCIVLFVAVTCYKNRRGLRNRVRAFIAANTGLPHHGIADASGQNTHSPNAVAPRGRVNISTTNGMNPDDYLSPISRDRMARHAEARAIQAEELQSIQAPVELEDPESQLEAAWPLTGLRNAGNPSSRWSTSNVPTSFQQRQLNRERQYNSLNNILIAPVRPTFESAAESVDSLIIAPNPRIGLDSPLVGGVSPLMGSDDRASVGEPPIRRGSITHCAPTKIRHSWARARCDSPLFGAPGTATSYTRGLPFLTPEQEIERGFRTRPAVAGAANEEPAAAEETVIAELGNTEVALAEADQVEAGSHEESAVVDEASSQAESTSRYDETEYADSSHEELAADQEPELSESVHTHSDSDSDSESATQHEFAGHFETA